MEEIWKDIEGFEGYYQASSFGNIKNDNRMENLEWCTNGENILHADRTGLRICAKGEETYASKLTEKKVIEIRESNLSNRELSVIYGVKTKRKPNQ